MSVLHLAASSATTPAGGAAIGQVIAVSVAAMLLTLGLLVFGLGHRSGRIKLLGRLSRFSESISGLPGWAAIPAAIATGALLIAAFGFYWDVSIHIDKGRDPGPLANPAHYFILAGLFGIFTAGWLAVVLPEGKPSRAAVRIAGDWYAPVSGLLLLATASYALIGFPLDDVWHRLFGQDVTLWGPTHLILLTGAAMSLFAVHGLLSEARDAAPRGERAGSGGQFAGLALLAGPRARVAQRVAACGGLLIALSIYQGEFDFGVPQFQLLFHPVLIALACSVAFVLARLLGGRGAAIGTVLFYLAIRGALAVLVGPVLGRTTPHFSLYVAAAVLTEGVALLVSPRKRPYAFAAVSGVAIGTVGTVAEYGWSHVWMAIPWPSHMLPEALLLSSIVGLAGGVIGAFAAGGLMRRADIAGTRQAAIRAGVALAAIAACLGFLLQMSTIHGRADVTLAKLPGGSQANATVRYVPASAARGADWVLETAWQGGGLVVRPMRRVADGVYTTREPLPISGKWKSAIRLNRGTGFSSTPVYLPADAAIPVAGVPASAHFTRALVADRTVLQRERKLGVPGWLWHTASFTVLALSLVLFLLFGRGLARLCGPEPKRPSAPPSRAARDGVAVA
ncbi:MAG: hypothetical protein ACR2ND_03615 [Solirubrobacteraceae bacterium]